MNSFNQREYQAVILGALLHDVGKFYQRAKDKPKSHDHCYRGREWFDDKLAEKLTVVFSEKEKEIIRSAIGNHHEYEEYIFLADAVSAGMERIKLEDEERGDPFTERLISIFSRLSISEKPKSEK
ncbi:MAG: HD domain-containing protein [Nitrospirota bacterium]